MRVIIFALSVTLHFSHLFAQDTIRILPLGNSITHAENRDANNYNSWRRQLFFDLSSIINAPDTFDFIGSQNTAHDNVPFPDNDFDPDHEGHWGLSADEIRDNLSSWLSNLDTPDIVLMHLGHNDCFGSQSVASTIGELEDIIDTLRLFNPSVSTFVAQVIPSTSSNSCLSELNDSIPMLVTRKNTMNSPVILVDQNSDFDAVADTYDGIHPNVGGELKMAARWFGALQGFIEDFLPVDLLYFVVDAFKEHRKISWGTANEIGIEKYIIERSNDLILFEPIGAVPANNGDAYDFVDKEVAEGDIYYRLKIIESSGVIEYSNIVKITQRSAEIQVYPNISISGALLRITQPLEGDLVLSDISGRIIKNYPKPNHSVQLPIISPGIYFIKSPSQGWVRKIIIKN